MNGVPPSGVRAHLPGAAKARQEWRNRLAELYESWGYQPIELPGLERYDSNHPRAEESFKLTDRDGTLLALRSDLTPAVARVVQRHWPDYASAASAQRPLRLHVQGTVWQAINPEITRNREITQVGVEFIGVRHPRVDAELIHLARESIRTVGLTPRVEVGNPGFVRALMDEAGVDSELRVRLADAIDRKDVGDVQALLDMGEIRGAHANALLAVPDLYGGTERLKEARAFVTGEASDAALSYLEGALAEFDDDSELLLDLGMARRLSYYTGLTFRAYTVDFSQPLLGGGRYDGALLPYAAGFSIGLERLESAWMLAHEGEEPAQVLALDDEGAHRLREAGIPVVRSIASHLDGAREEAAELGIPWLLADGDVHAVAPVEGGASTSEDEADRAELMRIIVGHDA